MEEATTATTRIKTKTTTVTTTAGTQEVVAAEEVGADEVDSGTEADGAAGVVTTTLVLPMLMVGRVVDKLLLLQFQLQPLVERLDIFARRVVLTSWLLGFLQR